MRAGLLAIAAVVLAGCSADATERFPAQHVEMVVPETARYPGLHVHGTLDGSGPELVVQATASNDGERTYRIETGCTTPWSEDLRSAWSGNGSVPMRKPTLQCQSYALRDLAPGQSVERRFTWDGTEWSDGQGRFFPAMPGSYTWSIRFVAYAPDGAALKRFDLDFPVTVR